MGRRSGSHEKEGLSVHEVLEIKIEKDLNYTILGKKNRNLENKKFSRRYGSDTIEKYVTCYPTVQTRLVPIQDHLWNLRRRFPRITRET